MTRTAGCGYWHKEKKAEPILDMETGKEIGKKSRFVFKYAKQREKETMGHWRMLELVLSDHRSDNQQPSKKKYAICKITKIITPAQKQNLLDILPPQRVLVHDDKFAANNPITSNLAPSSIASTYTHQASINPTVEEFDDPFADLFRGLMEENGAEQGDSAFLGSLEGGDKAFRDWENIEFATYNHISSNLASTSIHQAVVNPTVEEFDDPYADFFRGLMEDGGAEQGDMTTFGSFDCDGVFSIDGLLNIPEEGNGLTNNNNEEAEDTAEIMLGFNKLLESSISSKPDNTLLWYRLRC